MIVIRLLLLCFLTSSIVGCGGGSAASVVSTPPSITLSTSHTTITENSGTEVSITATASKTSSENIVVTLVTTGTATSGTDYTAISDTITILAGETANSTTTTVTNDSSTEGDETVIVAISSISGGNATESGTQSLTVTIVDDETTPSITLTSSATSLDEDSGTTVTLTATSSVAASSDITVTLATTGTATDGTDYSAVNGTTITISAGDTTGTKTFTITDDSVYEGNESVIVAISGVSGGSAVENGDQSINFRITENESVPSITLTTSTSSLDEDSGTTVTLTATSSVASSSSDITVTLATTGTATDGTDYSAVNGTTITISAGDTTGTKTFTITDDSVYEDDETVIVAISTVIGSSAQENGDQSVTTTITENESAPTITLATSASSIAENSSTTVTLTATASQIADEDITVTLATTGTGTSGTDYSAVNGTTITISAGDTTGTKTFTMTDDSVSEGDETAIVAISAVSGGGATESGTQSVTVTITDNDSPSITLTSSVSTLTENSSTTVTLTATSSLAASEDITVTLATTGTATDGTDYSAVDGTTITISAGDTTGTKTFTMTNDSSSEGDETIITAISAVSGGNASESGTQSVTFTIVDDESTPSITLTSSATSLDEDSGTTVTLTATSSVAASSDITVTLATTGTATDGTDYSAVNGTTITFSAGDTTGTKTFTITDDSVYEGDETAIVAISGVSGASAVESGSQSVTVTITENESAPTITLATSASSLDENSSTTVTLTATTSSTSTLDIVVTLGVTGTGTEGTDYSAIDETITISAGETTGTETFTMTDDSVYEGDETVIVAISSVTNASESGTQSVTTTITENESSPTVQISSSAASVYDNGLSLTITATSSQEADEAITVVIGTSGTSTEGTDYATVSDITISAGSTTGTATFNPTADTVNENSETAIISISSVSGADSAKGSTTSVTITINEYALRTATAFTEGTTAEQNAIVASAKWWYVDGADAVSTVHPYEQMNIHKVQSFTDGSDTLTGKGEFIHIADFNCDDNHMVYDNKTIHNLDDGGSGESTFDSATTSDYHCQFVATMAAGDITGSNLASGVAPDADLILSSIAKYDDWRADDWAADLDSARGYGAIASNNSWGNGDIEGYSTCASEDLNCNFNATEFQTLINNYPSLSKAQLLSFVIQGDTAAAPTATVDEYLTALDNFQSSGVIVFASGNSTYESDVDLMGALPEFFPDLAEAWISVGYMDFTGDSIADAVISEFTIQGNKCGSAQEYCVVADGTHVYGAAYVSGIYHYYKDNKSGSSFAAPMISGGIALMAQAFPNHTPAQLTDRLLASANNKWFTPEGTTTFTTHGNSVTHGYHSTWGQGLPDFYAAMSPITSNSNPAMALYMGNSIQSSKPISLESSYITPSSSLGDSLSLGLIGESGYAYDALSGGFKYDMSTRVNMTNNTAPTINLSSELSKLDSQLPVGHNSDWKQNFSQVFSTLSKRDGLETTLTLGASSLPVQSFFGSNLDSSANLSDFQTPYLESGEGGIGLSANYQLGNSRLLIGATTPILVNNLTGNVAGSRKSLVASLEYGNPSKAAFTLMTGITQDKDSLLGSTGNDAYSMSGSRSNTTFAAIKAQNHLNNDLTLTGIATVAKTGMSRPTESYINSANSVKSSSVSLIATQKNIVGDDRLSLSVSQPNRVSGGDMSIRLSNLAEADGSISYRNSNINLEPTGRQMVYGLSYRKDLDDDIGFSIKHLLTSNLNHNQDSDVFSSSYIGMRYKDLKLGFNLNSLDSSKNTELSYLHRF